MNLLAAARCRTSVTPGLAALVIAASVLVAPSRAQESTGAVPESVFARLNGEDISAAEFDHEARESFRRKFYHGKPPENEVDQMLRRVGQQLIDDRLLKAEAQVRKTPVDAAAVDAEIAQIDRRNANHPQWAAERATVLPEIAKLVETRHRVRNLETSIRAFTPTDAQVRAHYDTRPDLFTEPAKNKVSAILIPVDPAAGPKAWEAARDETAALIERARNGEDFAALAKAHSKGPNAEKGGDIGFVHQGTVAAQVEEELGKAKVGEIVGPVMTLEGYGAFRLDDRQPPRLMSFEAVQGRARDLLIRERSEAQWKTFIEGLRAAARLEIGPAFQRIMALPLPADPGTPGIASR